MEGICREVPSIASEVYRAHIQGRLPELHAESAIDKWEILSLISMGHMAGRGPARTDLVKVQGGEGQATARPAAEPASTPGLPDDRTEGYAHAHLIFLVANHQTKPDEIPARTASQFHIQNTD